MRRTARSSFLALSLLLPALALPGAASAGQDAEQLARRRTPVVEVFETARDAVVNISTTEVVRVSSRSPFDGLFEDFFEMPRAGRERTFTRESIGSGFVIHPEGYVVTNAHVVARTAEQKVTFADGREYDARVIAADPRVDLAVLKIDAEESFPTLTLGRSNDLMIGETVIAIGNPLGFQHTVTAGVVSATNRAIRISEQLAFEGLIQTDASINPGNSGGPLLNVLGELIGVNSAIRGDAQNIGFAIPVDHLRRTLPELIDVEGRYRLRSGLALDLLDGPRVVGVAPDSPAARAGIRDGDLLRSIDDRPVHYGVDFHIAMINRRPGDVLRLGLSRDGREVVAPLRLEERPRPDGGALARERLGLDLQPIDDRAAARLRLRDRLLVVADVRPGGPADDAGVRPGDVLLAIGRRYVADLDELGLMLEGAEEGVVVEIEILRDEGRRRTKRRGPIRLR